MQSDRRLIITAMGCVKKFRKRNIYMRRKRPVLWTNDYILQHDNIPFDKARSVKQFLAPQKNLLLK
jgi:hypothetical protein